MDCRKTTGRVACLALVAIGGAAHAQQGPTVQYSPEAGARQLIFVNNPEQLYSPYTDTFTAPSSPVTYYDLADVNLGAQSLLQLSLQPGSYRDYFEHVNRYSGAINYGVQIYNPNTTSIKVTLTGKGFNPDSASGFSTGASAISEMMNNERPSSASYTAPVTYTVAGGRSLWLLRTDIDYNGARPNNSSKYGAGVVDFEVSLGRAVVSNVAYQTLRNLGSWTYNGYITRKYSSGGTPESRVYKGLFQYPNQASATGAGVLTSLSFSVDEQTASGSSLPVNYKRYTNSGGTYTPSSTDVPAGTVWWTNDTPSRDKVSSQSQTQNASQITVTVNNVPPAYMIGNDMFSIFMPTQWNRTSMTPSASQVVNALTLGSWPNTPAVQPNLGNYGVLYHERITITNNGTRARTVKLTLNNYGSSSGATSSVAYQYGLESDPANGGNPTDAAWQWDYCKSTTSVSTNTATDSSTTPQTVTTTNTTSVNYDRTVTYGNFSVPADGQPHTYFAYFMLGAPASGQLRHAAVMGN